MKKHVEAEIPEGEKNTSRRRFQRMKKHVEADIIISDINRLWGGGGGGGAGGQTVECFARSRFKSKKII